MKNNDFWKLATKGGALPEQFQFAEWKRAWDHNISHLACRIDQFKKKASWEHYDRMGQSINRTQTLLQVLAYVPLFLPKMSEKQHKKEHGLAVAQAETTLIKARTSAEHFLSGRLYEGDRKEQARAKTEYLYWTGLSPKRAECVKMEHALQRDARPLHLARLTGLDDMPAMKRKLRQKAKKLGLTGYAVDPTDTDIGVVWRSQHDEHMRQSIWEATQKGPIAPHEVEALLQARLEWAQDAGARHFVDLLDKQNPGLSFYSVEKTLAQSLKRCAQQEKALRDARSQKGLKLSQWAPEHEEDIFLPWNEGFLHWHGYEQYLGLSGKEFPLSRVLNTIIPDILSFGGWSTIGAPQRIGRGKRCLYLYRLHKDGKMAMMYFAPYAGQDVKDSDSCQAYACMLRERWTNGTATTPIVLVAQNFDLQNGYLTGLDQLTFLCHELGHALHFFGLKGETFDEYSRMPNNLAELPSSLFEYLTHDPELLQKWCSPKFKAGRKKSYWLNRLPKLDLQEYVENAERAYMDLVVHRTHDSDLVSLHQKLRKQTGRCGLHPKDKSAYSEFDRTELAALFCTYGLAHALTQKLVPGVVTKDKVVHQMNNLIDYVLTPQGDTSVLWKKTFGQSLFDMYTQGVEALDKAHIQASRKEIRKIMKSK